MKNIKCSSVIRFLMVAVASFCLAQPSIAQVSDENRADLMFDLRLSRLAETKLFDGLSVNQFIELENSGDEELNFSTISRLVGAIQLPKQFGDMFTDENKSPLEFMAIADYAQPESAMAFSSFLRSNGFVNSANIEGVDVFSGNESIPENVLLCPVGNRSLKLGTSAYTLHENRNVMSSGLLDIWSHIPVGQIKLAVDLSKSESIIDELLSFVEFGDSVELNATAMFIPRIEQLGLSINLKSEKLVHLVLKPRPSTDLEDFRSNLDGVLFVVRAQARKLLDEYDFGDTTVNDSLIQAIDGIRTKTIDDHVVVSIQTPENFDLAVIKIVEALETSRSEFQSTESQSGERVADSDQ